MHCPSILIPSFVIDNDRLIIYIPPTKYSFTYNSYKVIFISKQLRSPRYQFFVDFQFFYGSGDYCVVAGLSVLLTRLPQNIHSTPLSPPALRPLPTSKGSQIVMTNCLLDIIHLCQLPLLLRASSKLSSSERHSVQPSRQ